MASRRLSAEQNGRVAYAIALIAHVPGYESVAADLEGRRAAGRIRFDPAMGDRGEAKLTGAIVLGSEAMYASALGLAETLVHEYWHVRRQFPLEKTVSFWSGVFTGTNVMRRYERPAYAAAAAFLRAAAEALPEWADDARAEEGEVRLAYAAVYGENLVA